MILVRAAGYFGRMGKPRASGDDPPLWKRWWFIAL